MHPDDRARARAEFDAATASTGKHEFEFRAVRPDGEFVVGRARLHPAILLPGLVLSLYIIGIPLLVVEALNWWTTEMAVTNQRLIMKRGWISRHTIEMQLGKIEHVGVEQGALGRMFGYGTVTVRGTGGTPEPISGVWNPMAFREAVQGQLGVAPAVRIA